MDYIGAVQGIPVCFDAKECAADTFPLQNIHRHQVEFMGGYEEQGGVSFFLIYFSHRQECYYLRYAELMRYWVRMEEELDEQYFIPSGNGAVIHYLLAMQKDLAERRKG